MDRVVTIGVYGFDPDRFFRAVVDADIDLFCDIRARRGVRGQAHAFANSRQLQERLSDLGIRYRHFPDLAPTSEIRALQRASDSDSGIAKRSRSQLAPSFVAAYERLLDGPEAQTALEQIRRNSSVPLLLCVERLPSACHRSIAAKRLADVGAAIDHLVP